ncbi:MAG: hypothetical protein HYS78_00860 [Parcubacteria group bacterium]|nr:hypothetical protein [Parcubacteria group bacterium]
MAKYNELTAGQSEACINRMGGWDNFLRFIGGQGKVVFDTILTFLRAVRVAAQPAVTTSEEYFKEAGVVWANDTFQAEFYDLELPATEEIELAVRKLEETSLDAPILAELRDKAEISVSQFRAFLAANRESSEWFIFYLSGRNGKRAVNADWGVGDGGWNVLASSVTDPDGWPQGYRVVPQV